MLDIFASPDVYQIEEKVPQGESTHEDGRGSIQRIDRVGGKVNILATKKSFARAGDLHKNTQFGYVFHGRVEVWTWENGKTIKRTYSARDSMEFAPGIPHLFIFREDSLIAEWWDGDFDCWYFKPYRKYVEDRSLIPDEE
ncbi:MAG TPA: hypothetical protein VLE93_00110 [Candidatus Saccharimonadales bacterium]|nr:hypothetical protein [Candidatus Saccharimonadales bacterium]